MSFDFGSSAPESDPTADFLARERAAAGALSGDAELFGASGVAPSGGDKDFSSGASAFPALDGDDSAPPPRAAAAAPDFGSFGDDDDLMGGGGAPSGSASAPQPPQQLDERDQFEQNFPDLAEPEPEPMPQQTNGHMAPPVASSISRPVPSASYGVAAADPYGVEGDEEPEAVRQWRARQADDIARRDAEAERKKAETVSKAERDIDQFYTEYNQKKEKNIAANKEAEAKFHAGRQAELAEGTTWARVTKLVDLQNSQSKTTARGGPGATDLSRYKEILLSLRREGDTAPAAAGY